MPFTRLRYHFVTSIKGRAPWILPDVEIVIHKAMCGRAKELGGVIMLINGVEDHQHIIAAVPPNITVSSFVGEVKSRASKMVNDLDLLGVKFAWQIGYSGFTLNPNEMDGIFDYVRNQKIHHAQGDLRLEYEPPEFSSTKNPLRRKKWDSERL